MAKKKKPGVMIYFDPLHKELYALDDRRAARLFRAILDHADPDPEYHREPDFSDDEVLSHVWAFVESDVNRDDETYRRKVGNKFSAFCRYCKENGYGSTSSGEYVPPITRQEWDDLGQPTYKQWSAYTLLAPAQNAETYAFDANAYNASERIQTHTTHTDAYNASERMQSHTSQDTEENASKRSSESVSISASPSIPVPEPISPSPSEPETDPCAPPSGGAPALSPAGEEALKKWIAYSEANGKRYREASIEELQTQIARHEADYGPAAVSAFIRYCISQTWRTIPWDRLERQQKEARDTRGSIPEEELRKYVQRQNARNPADGAGF